MCAQQRSTFKHVSAMDTIVRYYCCHAEKHKKYGIRKPTHLQPISFIQHNHNIHRSRRRRPLHDITMSYQLQTVCIFKCCTVTTDTPVGE